MTGASGWSSSGSLKSISASVALDTDGFSRRTCLPARMARTAHSKCSALGSGTRTQSMFGSSRIARIAQTVSERWSRTIQVVMERSEPKTHPGRNLWSPECRASLRSFRPCHDLEQPQPVQLLRDATWRELSRSCHCWLSALENRTTQAAYIAVFSGLQGTYAELAAPKMPNLRESLRFSTSGGLNARQTRKIGVKNMSFFFSNPMPSWSLE